MDAIRNKISAIEKILAQPYIKHKEQPYYLHTIIVHDGLAENGHYYSYVWDRVQKQWWMLNDHRAIPVNEEQVMKEALGGSRSYKSACNLFYISKRIAK